MTEPLRIAKASDDLVLLPGLANRHGLVAGATGTGKTVSLRVMAEAFSRIGVPVFMADVKGDLSGLAVAGGGNPKLEERAKQLGYDLKYDAAPVTFWDVFGEQGHPVRATVSDMGPLLLSRLLDLNDTQEGVLSMVFRIADDHGLLLLDLKDLRAMLQHVADNASAYKTQYGNVSAASVGAIQRGLLELENQGGDTFFGEPALDLDDLIQTGKGGRGMVNILAADKLMQSPKLYATFLLWMLSELFEKLPEVGDPDKPKLVFFFDEAHLLFDDAPDALLQKVEQVVRLIRSKGVGVYFCSQSPLDIPENVLGQLGNRVQHALRAFTPKDQKAVKTAAETFRAKPGLDVAEAITQLTVGEALVSFLDDKGAPLPVERALVYPPASRLAPLSADERAAVVKASVLYGHYEQAVDRDSAFEKLQTRAADTAQRQDQAASDLPDVKAERQAAKGRQSDTMLETMGKSLARAAASSVGRQLVRGLLGGLLGGGSRRSSW